MMNPVTAAEIEAARTPNGGWTKAQLAQWGIPWPPPAGWKKALTANSASLPFGKRPRRRVK